MKKRIFRGAILALLLAALCAAQLPGARAEIARSAMKDDGALRVYLSSLDSPRALTLTMDGNYVLGDDEGFRFGRGMQIRLYAGSGGIWMDAGGLTLDLGPELTLTRRAAEEGEENGLRIAETGRETLYPGDLRVSLQLKGGLRAVLRVNVEDYLRGVVAYEMSDSWPLEALKAQAVAARTYAMRAKRSAGERDYDVVDTTADQVYRGTDSKYQNVERAVRETEGVVGTWDGEFAACYYTASNGGEIALPSDAWGGEDDPGYLERKADPYDLENPHSLVERLEFERDASDLPALRAMLRQALIARGEDGSFAEIASIEPVDPVAEGSAVCAALRFTLLLPAKATPAPSASKAPSPSAARSATPAASATPGASAAARGGLTQALRELGGSPAPSRPAEATMEIAPAETLEPSASPEPERRECAVELDVYDQIKRGLDLSINRADCEVVSVAQTEDGFAIEMRRFGHGVGMSQRGAQAMAGTHGMDFEQILGFYYPGMALERIEWDAPELAALSKLPEGVGSFAVRGPTPTPAPLPALKAGEYYARVALGDAHSRMNLRQSPSTEAAVVTTLSHGQRVIVAGEADAGGWVRLRTAEAEGYAKLEYLRRE